MKKNRDKNNAKSELSSPKTNGLKESGCKKKSSGALSRGKSKMLRFLPGFRFRKLLNG